MLDKLSTKEAPFVGMMTRRPLNMCRRQPIFFVVVRPTLCTARLLRRPHAAQTGFTKSLAPVSALNALWSQDPRFEMMRTRLPTPRRSLTPRR